MLPLTGRQFPGHILRHYARWRLERIKEELLLYSYHWLRFPKNNLWCDAFWWATILFIVPCACTSVVMVCASVPSTRCVCSCARSATQMVKCDACTAPADNDQMIYYVLILIGWNEICKRILFQFPSVRPPFPRIYDMCVLHVCDVRKRAD